MAKIPGADLLELFLQESEACFPEIRQGLAVIKTGRPAMAAVQGLHRLFDKLGGAAERVQLTDLSRGVNIVATLLADLTEEDLPLSDRLSAALEQTVDLLEDFIWKKSPTPEDEVNLYARLALLFAEFSGSRSETPVARGDGRGRCGPAGQLEYQQAVRSVLPLMLELAGYLVPDGQGGKDHSSRIYGTLSQALLTLAVAARAARMEQQRRLLEEFHLLFEDLRSGACSRHPELTGLIIDFLEFLEAMYRGGEGEYSSTTRRVREQLRSLHMLSALLQKQFAETPLYEEQQEEPEAAETVSVEERLPEQEIPATRPEEADLRREGPEDLEELQSMEKELAAARDAMARVVEEFSDTLQELDRLKDSLRRRSRELAAGLEINSLSGFRPQPGRETPVRGLLEFDPAELDRCVQIDLLIKAFNNISADFNAVYATLTTLTGDIGGQLCRQQLTMRLLQDKLARVRMTPESAFSRVRFGGDRPAADNRQKSRQSPHPCARHQWSDSHRPWRADSYPESAGADQPPINGDDLERNPVVRAAAGRRQWGKMEEKLEIAMIKANSKPLAGFELYWLLSRSQLEFIFQEMRVVRSSSGIVAAHYQDALLPVICLEEYYGLPVTGPGRPLKYLVIRSVNDDNAVVRLILQTPCILKIDQLQSAVAFPERLSLPDNGGDILGIYFLSDRTLGIVPDLAAISASVSGRDMMTAQGKESLLSR